MTAASGSELCYTIDAVPVPPPDFLPNGRSAPKISGRSQVKGVAFRTVLWSVEQLSGAHQVTAVLARLSPPAREALRYGEVVAGGWYPVEWYAELLNAIAFTSHGGIDVIRSIAAIAIDHDITGVYRFLVEQLNPVTVTTIFGKLFPRYYSTGSIRVVSETRKHFRFHVNGCVGFTELMWQEIYASGKHLLLKSGAKNVHHHIVEGGKDGDQHLVIDARWE